MDLSTFLIVYCPYGYKTQRAYDEAVDDCITALKFIPYCFVTSKMLEKSDDALHANDDLLSYNEDFDKVKFIANQRHIFAAGLTNLENDNNFNENDSDTIIHAKLLAWRR